MMTVADPDTVGTSPAPHGPVHLTRPGPTTTAGSPFINVRDVPPSTTTPETQTHSGLSSSFGGGHKHNEHSQASVKRAAGNDMLLSK